MYNVPVNQAHGVGDQAEFMKWAPKERRIKLYLKVEINYLLSPQTVTLIFVCARGKPQNLSGVKNVGELLCRESTSLHRENKVAKIKLLKPLNREPRT